MGRMGWLGGSIAAAVLLAGATSFAAEHERVLIQIGAPGGSTAAPQGNMLYLASEPAEKPDGNQPGMNKPSAYWIGVTAMPVQPAMRAQLGLKEGEGLVVDDVMPKSPAAKAGIERFDVLLKAGGKSLGAVDDLIQAVEAAKDKALKLDLLRSGKSKTLEVKPEQRPETMAGGEGHGWPQYPGGARDWDQIRHWIEQMRPGEDGRPPMRFRFLQPGMILPPEANGLPPLPAGTSVAITKSGSEPAKIVVTQGDKKWEVTEKELDKLPADVRPQVERMLGRGLPKDHALRFDFVPEWHGQPGAPGAAPANPEARPEGGRLEKRLDNVERRLEQMRKSLDELRKERSGNAAKSAEKGK